ncbi:MAG: sirohydrochlorin chelatase [Stigonema ocellatum SAG 48.90 = DSM 106950]|nr:sirohydrochlorin chelatase [Stigonema ocellatum SAG 48.90 = DSM 106950]
MVCTYLLVSHGSRDPRPAIAMQQLAELLCKRVQSNLVEGNYQQKTLIGGTASLPRCENLVGTAYLELSPDPLHEQITKFAYSTIAQGCNFIKILPLFLLPGVHVMEDIPSEVVLARQALGQDIMIDLLPYLGSDSALRPLLEKQLASTEAEARILLAHGSRRPLSQQPVEALAASLGAVAAYWAVPPSLESRVLDLVIAGYRKIAIVPYFLFAGGITDAIAHRQQELKLQFPGVSFQLAEPLGASAELADLIWDLVER